MPLRYRNTSMLTHKERIRCWKISHSTCCPCKVLNNIQCCMQDELVLVCCFFFLAHFQELRVLVKTIVTPFSKAIHIILKIFEAFYSQKIVPHELKDVQTLAYMRVEAELQSLTLRGQNEMEQTLKGLLKKNY